MALTTESFRLLLPAFASLSAYPDSMVAMWLGVAIKQLNAERWGDMLDLGQALYTAHNLVLEAQAGKAACRGVTPGGQIGIQTSKSAGGVSVSYDVSSATEQGGGNWNQTTYGTRYYRLVKIMGAGPVQIGLEQSDNVSAWTGPLYFP